MNAALIAFALFVVFVFALVLLGTLSNTGPGSRVRDLTQAMKKYRQAQSRGEKLLVFFWFGRALFRGGYWSVVIAVAGIAGTALASVFGGLNWELARQMLCETYQFFERILTGKVTVCTQGTPP